MRYREYEPAHDLRAWVLAYWEVRTGARQTPGIPHVVWPDGCVSVSAPRGRPGGLVVGPRVAAFEVPLYPGMLIRGVRFRPEAGARALGAPAHTLRDVVSDLAGRLPADDAQAFVRAAGRRTITSAARAFDAWTRRRTADLPEPDDVVREAVHTLIREAGRTSVRELAMACGLSIRQFQRRFRGATGLTPKEFARIRRLRSVLGALLEPFPRTWSRIAAEYGYADQAHLVRDTAKLTGLSPTEVARRLGAIEHVDVRP